jgi:hypothetical protein
MTSQPEAGPHKVFCIGANKTGTTSLAMFFRSINYKVGNQEEGELLLKEWSIRNFGPIIELAKTADFFQDIPFSCPYTYQALDMAFPAAKFILSVRDSAEQWYRSLVQAHYSLIGQKRVPSSADLKRFSYRYKGWIYESMTLICGVSDDNPYDKHRLISWYTQHNELIRQYFRYKCHKLLEINISDENSPKKISEFLGIKFNNDRMPHFNRSDPIEI